MTFTDKKIEEFREKWYQHFSSTPIAYADDVICDWLKQTLAEAEIRNLKSVIEKCGEIDKKIFNSQDPAWRDRNLYCNEAKEASNALGEIAEFCKQKLKELEEKK